MYGSTTGAGGAGLAVTGIAVSSMVLAGIGLVFVGAAVYALFRKNGKFRP